MKYVISGGAGNVSHLIVEGLLKAGHEVAVIGRKKSNLEGLETAGATAITGDVQDAAFVQGAFAGADAVYTMVPPTFAVENWIAFIDKVGENYASAIAHNNIKYVVNLSSIGGHLSEGAGPVSGLNHAEEQLNKLDGVNVKHLRAGYFFQNFLHQASMVKTMGILGANFGNPPFKLLMAHPKDIARAAIEHLLTMQFSGKSVQYIVSDERNGAEIASVLGASVGKPQLPWVEFTDEQYFQGSLQAGLPEEIARNYTEMGHALKSGKMSEDFILHPAPFMETKLEDFADEFAKAYQTV